MLRIRTHALRKHPTRSASTRKVLTHRPCQCPACHEYFAYTSLFDAHRIGNDENESRNRRCLMPVEMRDLGWTLHDSGYWTVPSRNLRTRASLSHLPETFDEVPLRHIDPGREPLEFELSELPAFAEHEDAA